MARPTKTCEHCGRTDVGSKAAGQAIVNVPVRDYRNKVVGTRPIVVCRPKAAHRPQCNTLVTMFGHTPNCDTCAWANPPGSESKYRPRLIGQGGRRPRPVAGEPTEAELFETGALIL